MADLRTTIAPKSDQLNADDLIGQSKTIKITKVSLASGEQPIAINYEGDNGKPYLPCKSMRRVMVNVWGGDGNTYIGRSLTLYRDEKVLFGGVAVGGIRISHMSHIDKEITMALTATRANRKPFTVKPLTVVDTTISKDVQSELVGLITAAGIAPAEFLSRFGIKKTAELLESKVAEAKGWINAVTSAPTPCSECQQVEGHSSSCPNAEPN